MAKASQILGQYSTHKGSVRFNPDEDEKYPLTQSFYLNREYAKKVLGVKNLDKEDEIEITVSLVSSKSKEDASDEEDE